MFFVIVVIKKQFAKFKKRESLLFFFHQKFVEYIDYETRNKLFRIF